MSTFETFEKEVNFRMMMLDMFYADLNKHQGNIKFYKVQGQSDYVLEKIAYADKGAFEAQINIDNYIKEYSEFLV